MAGEKNARVIFAFMLSVAATVVSADETFDKLFAASNFKAALDYADEKIPVSDRDANIWVKIAKANTELGMNEKALACYMVSWRLNPTDYQSLLGCAKVYNNMNQPTEAVGMAKKALDVNFTAEASWEYAKACIALNRSADAKNALEKVIQSDAQNSIANRELGTIYYNEKAYTQAIPLLKKTYKLDPVGALAYKIGKSYIESGVADSAVLFLKDALSKGVQGECTIELSRAYFKMKNYKDAVAAFSNIPKANLTAVDLCNFAFAKESAGEGIAGAVELYEESITKFENSAAPEALFAREKSARYRLQTKKYDVAIKNLLFVLEHDAKGTVIPDVYFLLADAYLATGDMQKAISNLEKSISINSKNVEAYARLADAYQKNSMPDKAKQTLESMLSLSPSDPGVYMSLGQYNLKARKYTEAQELFEKSNSLKSSAGALEGLAIAQFNLKQTAQARASALRAVQMDATLVESRIILSKIFIAEANYKEAQGHLEAIVQKNGDLDYLKMLADCYLKNGKNEKLNEIDKKIAALSSTDLESRVRLAKSAEMGKNLQDALTLYKQILSINPEDPEIIYKLYELSNATGDNLWATIYLKKYLLLSPGNADAHGLLGDLYYTDKKNDEALSEYRAALNINPAAKGFLKRYAEIVIAKGLQDEVIAALDGLIKSGDADAGTYTTLGLIYEKKKMSVKAIEMYQSALQREPANIDALSALAGCQTSIGDVSGAIISYEQILMMNPKVVNEYKELGELYLRSFKQVEAIKAFKQYLARDSSNLEIVKMVGKEAYKNKEYRDAVRYLGLLVPRASDDDLFEYADACQMSGDTAKAIVALEQLKSRKLKIPLQVKVCVLLSSAYEKNGRDTDAIRILNELIVLSGGKEPDILYKRAYLSEKNNRAMALKYYEDNCKAIPADYRNFLRLGVLLSNSKETLPKAVEMLKRVTELAASVPVVWLELGKVYVKLNRDKEALDAFKKYAESDPQNLEANRNLGILLVKSGKINEGMVYLEIANTLQPMDPVVMANLAKGYLHTGRNSEAMELLLKVKELAKDDPEIRFELYELLVKSGQKDKALLEIRGVVELTNDPKYILIYAQALLDDGKIKEAQDAIEDILATNAENIDALMLKASTLRIEKKYDEAIEVYKELVYVKPEYAPAFYERAETHLLQNKFQWAETFYKRTLETDPKFALAEFGLAKIAKVRKDSAAYKLHLENASKLDPENTQIKEELSRAN